MIWVHNFVWRIHGAIVAATVGAIVAATIACSVESVVCTRGDCLVDRRGDKRRDYRSDRLPQRSPRVYALLIDRTAACSMIGWWHDTVVCLPACLCDHLSYVG